MSFIKWPVKFGTFRERSFKVLRTLLKCLFLSLVPVAVSAIVTSVWYVVLFEEHVHFPQSAEVILTAAWIPSFGILYCFIAGWAFGNAWEKYKTMRMAVKEFNFNVFMNLRDEEMTPLVHFLVLVFSFNFIGTFMGLHYADLTTGVVTVWTTTFLIALVYCVILEIDGPCTGLWHIKNIPQTWEKTDPKVWRARQWQLEHEHLMATDPCYKLCHEAAKAALPPGTMLTFESTEVHEQTATLEVASA